MKGRFRALRGYRDTTIPMVIAAIGYWVIGFAGGWLLAFPVGRLISFDDHLPGFTEFN